VREREKYSQRGREEGRARDTEREREGERQGRTSLVDDTLVAAAVTFFRRSELVPVASRINIG